MFERFASLHVRGLRWTMPSPTDPPKGGLWNSTLLLVAATAAGVSLVALAVSVTAFRARR